MVKNVDNLTDPRSCVYTHRSTVVISGWSV